MYLNLLLKLLFLVPTVIALMYICRELIVYQNMGFYRNQGVKCVYVPILGIVGKYIKAKGSNDSLGKLKKCLEDNANEPIVVFNSIRTLRPAVMLLDGDLIREFSSKELDCSTKPKINRQVNFGFFFENGHNALESRAAYAKFFNYRNLCLMSQKINEVIDRMMKEYANKNLTKGEWTQMDVKVYFDEIFSHLVNCILFGEDEVKYVEGEDLNVTIKHFIQNSFKVSSDPLNCLSLDVLNDLSLLSSTRQCQSIYAKLENACWDLVQERKKQGPKSTPNLLDLLIQFDEDRKAEGKPPLTKYDIAGHFILLQFAGSDTSHEISSNSVYALSKNEEMKKAFINIVDSIGGGKDKDLRNVSLEELEATPEYDNFCAELMRVLAPFAVLSPRELTKDIKLGKYQFRKGDRINIPSSLIHTSTRYFPQGNNIKPDMLKEMKTTSGKRSPLLTFGFGKRICIGKELGEIIVKMMLAHFFRNFELSEDKSYKEEIVMKLTYGFVDPKVLVRPRDINEMQQH